MGGGKDMIEGGSVLQRANGDEPGGIFLKKRCVLKVEAPEE